jgi:high-affinity nickel-transport protein
MIVTAFTAFALGLRHGADPDHLAAIDNLTRNSVDEAPKLSRFIGALFAGGHSLMVLFIAAIVGALSMRLAAHRDLIETVGAVISIVVLLLLAALNLWQLAAGKNDRVFGLKTQMLPAVLRNGKSPWLAIPVGLLFGLGFETSSQIATYALALGADAGIAGALAIGATFCAGMACTDTLDSVFIHRLVTYRDGALPGVMRAWIICVTVFAIGVAIYEVAQLLGWNSPISDLSVSGILVGALLATFAFIYARTRSVKVS